MRTNFYGFGKQGTLLAMSCLILHAAGDGDWLTKVVDSGAGDKFSSLRIDTYGNAHVAHFDEPRKQLNYSFWDHSLNKWFTAPIDFTSGFCSLALDSKQRPHISYPDGTGKVREAYWDGVAWQKRNIEINARVIDYYTSIAIDSNDNPSISFYEEIGVGGNQGRLRMVTWNGKFWALRTVDGDEGSGKFNSIAIDSLGNPQIAYGNVEYKNASLRYARWNGESWNLEILEGAGKPGTSMWSVSLLLDKMDVPHIAYTDVRNQTVKYGTAKGGRWELRAVDSVAKVAYPDRNGIALDSRGNPYISYYDAGLGLLKVAHLSENKWVTEVVDQNYTGYTSSLQIAQGYIWVTYADEASGRLKFARRLLERGHPLNSANAKVDQNR
jgi:hypothetical protein